MSDNTSIEWTSTTWNVVTGCSKVSPGCAHCYIERTPPFRMNGRRFVRGAIPVQLHPERLDWPLTRWKEGRRIFVDGLADLFHEDVPDEFIDRVFAVMAQTPWHTYQVLTKRPGRMHRYLTDGMRVYQATLDKKLVPAGGAFWPEGGAATRIISELARRDREQVGPFPRLSEWPLPNVWLGVSVENQHFADERIPLLLQTPAVVRFLSCEPLLGPVDLERPPVGSRPNPQSGVYPPWLIQMGIDWVIVGGESGPKARPMDLAWARSLVEQCRAAGLAVFVKQLGAAHRCPHSVKGGHMECWPDGLRVREFPEGQ